MQRQYFYDASGKRIAAAAYRPVVERLLRESAGRLPVRVSGDAHWSVVRLDPTHVRITLIDSGYLDPADREADIILQHLNGGQCTDILSGETVPVTDGRIHVKVPMGTLRIVDVEHR